MMIVAHLHFKIPTGDLPLLPIPLRNLVDREEKLKKIGDIILQPISELLVTFITFICTDKLGVFQRDRDGVSLLAKMR